MFGAAVELTWQIEKDAIGERAYAGIGMVGDSLGACHVSCVRTRCFLSNSTLSHHYPSGEVRDKNIQGSCPAGSAGAGFTAAM